MAGKTTIEWATDSWNPVRGCSIVSPGCTNCYAMKQAHRFSGAGQPYDGLTKLTRGGPVWTGKVRTVPDLLDQPLRWKKPRRIFVNSMSDLFHEAVSVEFILAVWAVMEASPQHTYQILTKRAKRMRSVLSVAPVARTPNVPVGATVTYERREIPGWPGYYADTNGVIWSDRHGRLRALSPCVTSKWGHAHVTLHAGPDVAPQQIKVHRLVLTTFDRAPADGEEACHVNGDAADNRVANLRWGSRADNSADRTAHGNAVTDPVLTIWQVAEVRIAALRGESQRNIGLRYGISHTQVGRIVSGESWGFKVLPNVWLGVSVEDQQRADERIPLLLQTPAAVRWISAEPLLGPVELSRWLPREIVQNVSGRFPLDDEIREQRRQKRNGVLMPVDLPSPDRKPPAPLDALVVPSHRPTDCLDQPVEDGGIGREDGHAGAVRAPGATPPVEVPLPIEKAGHVSEHGHIGRDRDRARQVTRANAAQRSPGGGKSSLNSGARCAEASSNFGDGGAVSVGRPDFGERKSDGLHNSNYIQWVVVGGESGPKARRFDVQWARSIVSQCKAAGVPVFVKQIGSEPRGWCEWNAPEHMGNAEAGELRRDGDDGKCINYEAHEQAQPCSVYGKRCVMLNDRKGGDPVEWPEDLRVREYPA